jgi:hypothetical protein
VADLVEYVLLSDVLSQEERARVVREAVDLLTAQADTYETDIPLSDYDQWPRPVQHAAHQLLRTSNRQQDPTGTYARTGVLHRTDGDHATWSAFTAFAAYALDATVWDEHGRNLVSVADEGTSAVFTLTAAQAERITAVAVPAEVLPLATWRARQRELRRAARRRRWTRLWGHQRR